MLTELTAEVSLAASLAVYRIWDFEIRKLVSDPAQSRILKIKRALVDVVDRWRTLFDLASLLHSDILAWGLPGPALECAGKAAGFGKSEQIGDFTNGNIALAHIAE